MKRQRRFEDYWRENPPSAKRPWRYVRIVGWIEIYNISGTIKADLWMGPQQRVTRNFVMRRCGYRGKIADVAITHHMSNDDIRSAILSFLENVQKGEYVPILKRRFIDYRLLKRNLPYLDIKHLLEDRANKLTCPG